jgi:hypothetical protein
MYRCQRGIEIGHVCVACLARSIPVVLNVAIPAELIAKEFARRGAAKKLSPMTQHVVDSVVGMCGKSIPIIRDGREVGRESCFEETGHKGPCQGWGKT